MNSSIAYHVLANRFVRPVLPILLALSVGSILLALLGADPFAFAAEVIRYGLLGSGWQNSLTVMAPLMLIALALVVAFRAGLWNLGSDGQFLVPAALVAGLGPMLVQVLPVWLSMLMLMLLATVVGAAWALLPAWLKAKNNTNEIVTTLVMSFIGVGVANMLIKGPFQDSAVLVPQTRVMPQEALLAYIPGTHVHVGVLLALAVLILGHLVLTRTSLGTRIDVLGGNPRAARHLGLNTLGLTLLVFGLSGAAVGFAASVDILGVWGYARTNFNPAYGIAVIPFVLMARLNVLAALPLLAFYAVFATGTTIAAQHADISIDLMLILIALILGFLALTEWVIDVLRRRSEVSV